jgi:hypothetical protein
MVGVHVGHTSAGRSAAGRCKENGLATVKVHEKRGRERGGGPRTHAVGRALSKQPRAGSCMQSMQPEPELLRIRAMVESADSEKSILFARMDVARVGEPARADSGVGAEDGQEEQLSTWQRMVSTYYSEDPLDQVYR